MLSLTPPRPAHGGVSSFSLRLKVKRLADILFVFGCLSILALVCWQPQIVSLQHKAGILDLFGFPLRWLVPFLALTTTGFNYCRCGILHAGRENQFRLTAGGLFFGLVAAILAVPVLLSLLLALLCIPFRGFH